MKIFIELPTWLGDAVMASSAIELICENFKDAKLTFFGSFVSTQIYEIHPKCEKIIIDNTKKSKNRVLNIKKVAQNCGKFDIAFSFRSSFISKILLFFINSKQKFIYKKNIIKSHQVLKYLNFIENSLKISANSNSLKLYFKPKKFTNKTLGLNPGASYGSAKRWEAKYFAQVGLYFSDKFDILIFGSKSEEDICNKIEKIIKSNGKNCINLCSKTSVKELCENISGVDIFITNDSGPMHIAAAYKVKTIALFGPTKFEETSPFSNNNAIILHKNFPCQPCMKRICPIQTHICMKELKPDEVIKATEEQFAI